MADNEKLHQANKRIFHGWKGATFFTDGVAQTGSGNEVVRELHEAIFLPMETILREAGLVEGSSPVPYDQRQPAIRVIEQLGRPIFGANGAVIRMQWEDIKNG